MSPELTVLIPALDEEIALRKLLPEIMNVISGLGIEGEIDVIDGGSRDATAEVARSHGARVRRQTEPGYGGALREGLKASRGRWVATMDGDGSHPPGLLARLWEAREGHDLVIASRYCPGGSAEMPLSRQILSRSLNLVARRALGWAVRDSSSGLRLYRGDAVRGLALGYADFSIQQEALARLLHEGGNVAEIPFHYDPRLGGKSKAKVLPLAVSYLRMLRELRALRGEPNQGILKP